MGQVIGYMLECSSRYGFIDEELVVLRLHYTEPDGGLATDRGRRDAAPVSYGPEETPTSRSSPSMMPAIPPT